MQVNSCQSVVLISTLYGDFYEFLDLNNRTATRVFCVKASQREDSGMIHFSQPYQPPPNPPPPPITMPLCAAPTAWTPTSPSPTCEMLLCCLVHPQLEHLALHPSTPLLVLRFTQTTPPFFWPHYTDCFRGQARKRNR